MGATVPNQKTLKIHRVKAEAPFTQISQEVMFKAMRDLTPANFQLWIYLCGNRDGYSLALSPADFMKQSGKARSSYDRAIKELIEKHYLVETTSNHFDFYEDADNAPKKDNSGFAY